MFLAPLNYDRFFKKIFSDKKIAKRFIEDFFEVTIQEIDLVSLDHKLTNESNLLRFDFRCKIDGEYIIVDMQQWYKQDIVQRFDVYVKDDIFIEIIRKLSHKSLDAEDLNFLEYYRLLEGQRDVWESQYKEEGKQIGLEEAQQQIKQAESKAQQTQDQATIAMIKNTSLADEAIANALGIPIKRVRELRKKTQGS